jgi:hypothetical protein
MNTSSSVRGTHADLKGPGLEIWHGLVEHKQQITEPPLKERLYSKICKCTEIAKLCAFRIESLEKVIKNSHRAIDITTTVTQISDGTLIEISTSFKSSIEFLESIRIIGSLKLLLVPQKNQKYFLFDPANNTYKKCDRLLLAAHTACKSMRTLNKWKLIDLGRVAKVKVGAHLTVFHLVTDNLMIGSSLFGLWDLSIKLKKFTQKYHNLERKITKWIDMPSSLDLIKSGDQPTIQHFQNKCERKIEQLKLKLINQAPEEKKQPIAKLKSTLDKCQNRLDAIKHRDYTRLEAAFSIKELRCKLARYNKEQKVYASQSTSLYLKVASSVAKIFVITMALTLTAINLWSSIPLITLLSLGIIADTLGLVKIMQETNSASYDRCSYHRG